MAREFWQHKTTGEIWVVELDDQGHVIGNISPLYTGEDYLNMHTGDFTDEDTPLLEMRDNDWLEEHRDEFVFFGDESEIGRMENRGPGSAF